MVALFNNSLPAKLYNKGETDNIRFTLFAYL